MKRAAAAALLIGCLLAAARSCDAQTDSTAIASPRFHERLSYRVETLAYGSLLDLKEESLLNPNNLFGLPRYQAEIDFRPDFSLNLPRLFLSLKPRYELRRRWFEEGRKMGTTSDGDSLYVQEGFARLRVTEALSISYGRENLQWGPSYLVSPSNPYVPVNGQNNPRQEVPGLDYARATWIPSYRWSFSWITNTGRGRLPDLGDFERRHALKADYTGEGKYVSLLLSRMEDEGPIQTGAFAGWSASDALLLHAEGSVEDEIDHAAILAGCAYTFEPGFFVVTEYYYNGAGCGEGGLWSCDDPFAGGWVSAGALARRNYGMLQFTDPDLLDRIHLTGRWVHNFDDGSDRWIGIYEHEVGDHLQGFAVGGIDSGDQEDEFGSLASGALMAGIAWIF
jgi:hypothetical protein